MIFYAGTQCPGLCCNERLIPEAAARAQAQAGDLIVLCDEPHEEYRGFLKALLCTAPGAFEDTAHEYIARPEARRVV